MLGDRKRGRFEMRRNRLVSGLFAALLVFGFASIASAEAAEQIVFSGTGFGTFDGTETSFGFWIWCESEEANNPYAEECRGAIYFYALGITKGVEGDVEELSEGVYQMTVMSRKGGSVSCMLTNALTDDEPTSGPTNTVDVNCTTPSGSGQSTNSVVVVTGPPE
jgi:hypothetical protein